MEQTETSKESGVIGIGRPAGEALSWANLIPAVTGIAALLAAVILTMMARHQEIPLWQPLLLAGLAFCCEFVDSSLGMGYGTTLTPLLLLAGVDLKVAVPVILLSEFLTGLTAGGFHHALGNASFKAKSKDTRIALILAAAGIFGALVAVKFLTSVKPVYAKGYFATMITAMGLIIILRGARNYRFSWLRIVGLGLISSFNKGMSGGGYGPLVVGGQVLSGCETKNAVACTSISESLVCLVALIGFAASGVMPDSKLAIPIVVGALLSAPCASVMTRYLDSRLDLRKLVGFLVLVLGIFCFTKVF